MRGTIAALFCLLVSSPAAAQGLIVPVPCVLADGETLESIASRFGVTVGDLAELNRDTDLSALGPGAEISVGYGERVQHHVARGDTLLRLARRYGVSATDIARWNGLADPRRLRADTTLIIYAWPRIPPSSSVGRPSHGRLENAVQLRSGPRWEVHDRAHSYVTREAAAALAYAFDAVATRWPQTPRVEIRDASAEHGGPLHGHHSHQSGRDVDLAYFRRECAGTCVHGHVSPEALDAEREWALLDAWLRAGVLEYVFIDIELQEPLYRAARASGATTTEVARWFQWPSAAQIPSGIIRHAHGHRDHLHVRFACASHDSACGRPAADSP